MSKGNIGILVFFYCLKTLGWVATTVGVFLTFRYMQSWLHSAWKKEMQRSANRGSGEEEYAHGDSSANVEHFEPSTASPNVISPKNDLPPSYDDLMKDRLNVQTVTNGNHCSIHNPKSDHQNPSYSRNNTPCNCDIPTSNTSVPDNREMRYVNERNSQSPTCRNSYVLPSTSIPIDSISTSLNNSACNSSNQNNTRNELPLIDGVKRLNVGRGHQTTVYRMNFEEEKGHIDDDSEPPPCYSELFEKPFNPSGSNIK